MTSDRLTLCCFFLSSVITELICLETTVADQAKYIEGLECREQDLLDKEDVNEMKRQHATVVRQVGREADKGWHASIIKEHRGWSRLQSLILV